VVKNLKIALTKGQTFCMLLALQYKSSSLVPKELQLCRRLIPFSFCCWHDNLSQDFKAPPSILWSTKLVGEEN